MKFAFIFQYSLIRKETIGYVLLEVTRILVNTIFSSSWMKILNLWFIKQFIFHTNRKIKIHSSWSMTYSVKNVLKKEQVLKKRLSPWLFFLSLLDSLISFLPPWCMTCLSISLCRINILLDLYFKTLCQTNVFYLYCKDL